MKRIRLAVPPAVALGWAVLVAAPCFALSPSNILVLYNTDSSDGYEIASYYEQVHPGVRVLGLDNVPVSEEVAWDVYLDAVRQPILESGLLTDSVDCIVTTKGLPLRINNPMPPGTYYFYWKPYSSLESELARIDTIDSRELMGKQGWDKSPPYGNPLAANPYFYQDAAFDYDAYGMRLASRLDGFSTADVLASIDRAQRAVTRPGYRFLLDDDPNAPASVCDKMENLAASVLPAAGMDFTYDGTDAFVRDAPGRVLGYVSHGVYSGAPGDYLDPANTDTGLTIDLAKGAAFHTWESYNAYTFQEEGIAGMPYRQGLVAEWIARGGTAGTGHVEEPGVSARNVANEDRLFEMLLGGYTWAEAAWNATRQLSYVNTVVGDPLMVLGEWLPGDIDLDGDVDMFDLTMIKSAYWTSESEERYNLLADLNADGFVDFWDLTWAKSHYTGPILGGDGAASIPEPVTLGLLAAGAGGLLLGSGRGRRGSLRSE